MMMPVDYARMAEACATQAAALPPSKERDDLLKKVRMFESYAKMEDWVPSSQK
jgi:hypothetical protein